VKAERRHGLDRRSLQPSSSAGTSRSPMPPGGRVPARRPLSAAATASARMDKMFEQESQVSPKLVFLIDWLMQQ
jgi:hypothetical protein